MFSLPAPASFLPAAPQSYRRIVPRDPDLSASPHLPHALPPQATGTARRAKRSPGLVSAPALWGEPPPSPPAQQPGTAKRHPDGGMRVGWGAQLGQGQCFQRGRETGPRNIPLSRKFPFRGHGVCARRARGAGGGGVGVDRVAAGPPPPAPGTVRREGGAGSEVRAGRRAAPSDPGLPREPYPSNRPPPAHSLQPLHSPPFKSQVGLELTEIRC